jgi:hypothetical protein
MGDTSDSKKAGYSHCKFKVRTASSKSELFLFIDKKQSTSKEVT